MGREGDEDDMTGITAPASTGRATRSRGSRRFGYVVSILVNLLVLWIANNLLGWGWFPWLTDDFSDVLPFIDASIGVSIAVDAVSLFRDPPWFRSAGTVVGNAVSLVATVRMLQVFPFDFSDYTFPWAAVVRVLLVVACIGIVVATIVEVAKLTSGAGHGDQGR
jgi:hypothetical protein